MQATSTVFILTGIILTALVSLSHAKAYNCARVGSECYFPEDTCTSEGLCNCSFPNREGADCSLDTTLVTESGRCDPPCGNGTCLSDNTCYCKPEKYGERCDKERVSLKCFVDWMEITVKPNVGKGNEFKGLIKVKGSNPYGDSHSVSDCVAMATAGEDDVKLAVRYSDCGSTFNMTTMEGDRQFTFQLLVLFSPPLIRSTDLVFDASCILLQEGKLITFTSEVVSFSKGSEFSKKKTLAKKINPIHLTVVDMDTSVALIGASVVGKPLVLEYHFYGGKKYSSFILDKVDASSGTGETVTLIEAGCPVPDNLIVKTLLTESNYIRVYFAAFKFIGSNLVTFVSKAKLCNNPNHCNQTDCTNVKKDSAEAPVRKRRDVTDDENDDVVTYKELDTTIVVAFPSSTNAGQTRPGVTDGRQPPKECTGQSLLLLIICGVLAALLLFSTGCGLFHYARMRLVATGGDVTSSRKKLFRMSDGRDYS